MISGFFSVRGVPQTLNELLRKLFNLSMPVMKKVFTAVPTTETLPQQTMGIYESGSTRRIYFNINGTICYEELTDV